LRDRLLKLVQHQINCHAGDRDVKPDGKSPARDAPVRIESFTQGAKQRDQRQRYHRRGEDSVADEDRKIDRANPTLAFEPDRTDLEVVHQIGNEKYRRTKERRQHAGAMGVAVFGANEQITGKKKNGAETIQRRVESRKL